MGALADSSPAGGTGAGGIGAGAGAGGRAPGGASGGAADKAGGGADIAPPPAACNGTVSAGALRLRRLTRAEYNNSVRDLLGDTIRPATGFSADEAVGTFEVNTSASLGEGEIRQFQDAAELLAKKAIGNVPKLTACDVAAKGEDVCVTEFVKSFAYRAFRRPLAQAEVDALASLSRTAWSAVAQTPPYAARLRIVIQAVLMSPSFLYRPEVGIPVTGSNGGDLVKLNDYEIATRLSYMLAATTPDSALLGAAAAGKLSTPAGIEAEARRLMALPGFTDSLDRFHVQWLDLQELATTDKEPPDFTELARAAMFNETRLFAEDIIAKGDGKLQTLMTSTAAFVTSALAKIYGVKYPGTALEIAPRKVTMNAGQQRAGILTQAAFLAAHSHPEMTSPVFRGKAVRTKILCEPIPPPPPNANVTAQRPPAGATTRDTLEAQTRDPTCGACHRLMNPIGFGLESYDTIGRFRATENGLPINNNGEFVGLGPDLDGPFKGAAQMMQRIAGSDRLQSCVVDKWLEYAIGRKTETDHDVCSLAQAKAAFVGSGGNVRDLVLAVIKTDAFAYGRRTR
jgi:hypothetical protein